MSADRTAAAALILVAALWLLKHWWRLMCAWADRNVDAMVERALSDPLPDVDTATDAEFEAWAMRALWIANAAAFEADARAEIEALTRGEIQW